MKKEKDKKQKQDKPKLSKAEQVLDWLKFLALVLIVLPPCTFIFEGFNPYGLIFVGVGVVLFVVNLFIAFSMQKNQQQNQSDNQSKGQDKKPQKQNKQK